MPLESGWRPPRWFEDRKSRAVPEHTSGAWDQQCTAVPTSMNSGSLKEAKVHAGEAMPAIMTERCQPSTSEVILWSIWTHARPRMDPSTLAKAASVLEEPYHSRTRVSRQHRVCRNRNDGVGYMPYAWVLGPLGKLRPSRVQRGHRANLSASSNIQTKCIKHGRRS